MAEHSANARSLIIHEVMGRNCGLAHRRNGNKYREWLMTQEWNPGIGLDMRQWDIHAVYVPEMSFDVRAEASLAAS